MYNMTVDDFVADQQIDGAMVAKAIYTSAAGLQSNTQGTKAYVYPSLVLAFYGQDNPGLDDPSNLKRFVTPAGDGDFRVFRQQVGAKFVDISVEYYDNILTTATIGATSITPRSDLAVVVGSEHLFLGRCRLKPDALFRKPQPHPNMIPSIGRIVHIVLPEGHRNKGGHRAAIITAVYQDKLGAVTEQTPIDATVFLQGTNEAAPFTQVDGTMFDMTGDAAIPDPTWQDGQLAFHGPRAGHPAAPAKAAMRRRGFPSLQPQAAGRNSPWQSSSTPLQRARSPWRATRLSPESPALWSRSTSTARLHEDQQPRLTSIARELRDHERHEVEAVLVEESALIR